MIRISSFILFFGLSLHICQLQAGEFAAIRINQDQMQWIDTGNGVKFTPVSGEEKTVGMYVFRVKFPPGYKNEPHYHTDERVVTVLAGTILVGFGKEFKESDMQAVSQGGIYTEPKNQPHYVWAKDGEVIIQVVGSGNSKRFSVSQEVPK